MGLRFLGSFAAALVLGLVVLVSASTFVEALEPGSGDSAGAAADPGAEPRFSPLLAGLTRESSCDVMRRELHALSHEVIPCGRAPECQGSPLACPRALDPRIAREYERLRDALDAECGLSRDLVDFAWELGRQPGESSDTGGDCALVHDGFEAAVRGEARPTTYTF